MGLIYDKPAQKATLIQVLQGGDEPVTCTDLEEKRKDSSHLSKNNGRIGKTHLEISTFRVLLM